MKKLLYLLPLSLVVAGCVGSTSGGGSPSNEDSVAVNAETPQQRTAALKPFFDDFVKSHPNLLNNSLTKDEGAKELADAFSALASADSLACISDVPLTYEMMLPYPNGTDYVVKFAYSDYLNKGSRPTISDAYEVGFQVFAKLPKEKAIALKENRSYYVTGRFVGYLTPANFTLPSGGGATDVPSIGVCSRLSSTDPERPDFGLGTLIVEGLTFRNAGR